MPGSLVQTVLQSRLKTSFRVISVLVTPSFSDTRRDSIKTGREKELFRVGRSVTMGNGRKQSREMSRLTIKKNILALKPEKAVQRSPKGSSGNLYQ